MNTRRKPTHPGEILREDIIKPLGITVTEAAKRLGSYAENPVSIDKL